MTSITSGPETKIFSNSDFVNLPIEALMVGVCGNMAAALDLDIRSQLLAISKSSENINTLTGIWKKVKDATPLTEKETSMLSSFKVSLASGSDEPTKQKNMSAIQQALDSENTVSQDQSTRLQSLKEKYSQMYKLMAGFSKTVFDTSSGIVSRTG